MPNSPSRIRHHRADREDTPRLRPEDPPYFGMSRLQTMAFRYPDIDLDPAGSILPARP